MLGSYPTTEQHLQPQRLHSASFKVCVPRLSTFAWELRPHATDVYTFPGFVEGVETPSCCHPLPGVCVYHAWPSQVNGLEGHHQVPPLLVQPQACDRTHPPMMGRGPTLPRGYTL